MMKVNYSSIGDVDGCWYVQSMFDFYLIDKIEMGSVIMVGMCVKDFL